MVTSLHLSLTYSTSFKVQNQASRCVETRLRWHTHMPQTICLLMHIAQNWKALAKKKKDKIKIRLLDSRKAKPLFMKNSSWVFCKASHFRKSTYINKWKCVSINPGQCRDSSSYFCKPWVTFHPPGEFYPTFCFTDCPKNGVKQIMSLVQHYCVSFPCPS